MLGERTMRFLVFGLALLGWAALIATYWLGYDLDSFGLLSGWVGITVIWWATIAAMFRFCNQAFTDEKPDQRQNGPESEITEIPS